MKLLGRGVVSFKDSEGDRAALTFPTVTSLSDGSLLATYRAGSRKDSSDGTIEIVRSSDGGISWSVPERLFETEVDGVRGSLRVCYLTELKPEYLLAAALWVDREKYPDRPLFNVETHGCLPMLILLAESNDLGKTWSDWRIADLPVGPGPFSLTNPIVRLPDQTLGLSVETNKEYESPSRWRQMSVLFRRDDQGWTWKEPATVAEDPSGQIFYWDQRLCTGSDGTLAAFTWTFDSRTNSFLNIHRFSSRDAGRTWEPLGALSVRDQPGRPAVFASGKVLLPWVDRYGSRSIRARIADGVGEDFGPLGEVEIWREGGGSDRQAGPGKADVLSADGPLWSFGLPYAEVISEEEAIVVYYAGLEIHWARVRI